jgi:hypothetical protein
VPRSENAVFALLRRFSIAFRRFLRPGRFAIHPENQASNAFAASEGGLKSG